MSNIDAGELARFEDLADRWWDPGGEFRALHAINPPRLEFVAARAPLAGRRVLDVGCGGGLLAEAMARAGALVTGIDAGARALAAARRHAERSGLAIEYVETSAEALAEAGGGPFDVVTCMELVEHVPEPGSLIAACARLARPGGDVFFSTINRTPRAWALAVVGAEYVLGLLPKGTHDYARFVRPSELAAWARAAGLELREVAGLAYNPLSGRARLGRELAVNYLAWLRRGE